jgi:hypothetical protein
MCGKITKDVKLNATNPHDILKIHAWYSGTLMSYDELLAVYGIQKIINGAQNDRAP